MNEQSMNYITLKKTRDYAKALTAQNVFGYYQVNPWAADET